MDVINRLKYNLIGKKRRNRWSYEDYLFYRMQYLKNSEIDKFLTTKELWDFEAKANDDEKRYIFNSKREFNHIFAEYMHRDILYVDDITNNEIIDFINRHKGKALLKPDNMYAGLGISILSNSDISAVEAIRGKGYILEEYLYNDATYRKVYDKCLNTIRVTTIIIDGEPRVAFAFNQFGSEGSIVDNDDITSIWSLIDENGVVFRPEVDDEGLVYDTHPDSGERLVGFVNKRYKEVISLALKAAIVVPECRLVGWDIAVLQDDSIELIEGNVTPELEMYQRISGHGLRDVLGIDNKGD